MPTLVLWEATNDEQVTVSLTNPLPVQSVGGGGSSDVNLVSIGGVTSSVNNGASDNGTLRVTIANDSTGVLASIGSITNPVTVNQGTSPWVVSGTVTANQGGSWTVAATQSGTWDIGTVSTITNVVHVDDNGGSITVDGTVAVSSVGGTVAVTQSTSPWVVSGTVTANQGGSWTVAATQSGTWTVQPGNTANTTAWLVTGTGGTFPVTDSGGSLTVDNNGTFAVQAAQSGTWNIGTVTTVTAVTSITNPVAVTQSGTWTVQPGNTANTTPWLISSKTDLAPASPTAASVGVASAQAVAANASRKGLALVNTSVNRISLGFGAAAVLDSGITLYPGGTFEMDENIFDLGAVNAIASAASSNLAIQEYS